MKEVLITKTRPNEKLERNIQILLDKENGMSLMNLSFKYRLHTKTIWEILRSLKNRSEVFETTTKDVDEKKSSDNSA